MTLKPMPSDVTPGVVIIAPNEGWLNLIIARDLALSITKNFDGMSFDIRRRGVLNGFSTSGRRVHLDKP